MTSKECPLKTDIFFPSHIWRRAEAKCHWQDIKCPLSSSFFWYLRHVKPNNTYRAWPQTMGVCVCVSGVKFSALTWKVAFIIINSNLHLDVYFSHGSLKILASNHHHSGLVYNLSNIVYSAFRLVLCLVPSPTFPHHLRYLSVVRYPHHKAENWYLWITLIGVAANQRICMTKCQILFCISGFRNSM